MTPPHTTLYKKKFKKSKSTENWWKIGENFLTGSETKKFKFYILIYDIKKNWGGGGATFWKKLFMDLQVKLLKYFSGA